MKKDKDCFIVTVFCLFFLFTIPGGCMKDDGYGCRVSEYRLVIKTDGQEMKSNENIHDIFLFLFDENGRFLDGKAVALNQIVELSYPGHKKLYGVVWGNIQGGHQTVSPAQEGLLLSDASVLLEDSPTRAQSDFALSPDELFHGIKELDLKKETRDEPDVLVIKRKVAAMRIITKHLKEYTESVAISSSTDDVYSYQIRSSKNALDFFGRLTGSERKYLPVSAFNSNNELIAPAFFVLPTEKGKYVEIDIFRGNELIYTVKTDQNGQLIHTEEGKFIEVVIDFSTNTDIVITTKGWDNINISEDF